MIRRRIAGAVLSTAVVAAVVGPMTAVAEPDPPVAPTPTVEQILADLTRITDPSVPWQEKSDVVEPGFAPDEGATIDDHLNRLNAHGYIPFTFVVTDVQPAPNDYAGSTVSIPHRPWTPPGPVVLVKRGEQWKVTHDTAMKLLNAIWFNVNGGGGGGSSYNPMQPGTSGMT